MNDVLEHRDYQKRYHRENRPRIRVLQKQWRIAHPERHREYKRRWEMRNPDKVMAWNRIKNQQRDTIRAGARLLRKLIALQSIQPKPKGK